MNVPNPSGVSTALVFLLYDEQVNNVRHKYVSAAAVAIFDHVKSSSYKYPSLFSLK